MEPVLQEFIDHGIPTLLCGDSGFASPKLYPTCESNGCSYAIRLKLMKIAAKAVRSAGNTIFKKCSNCPYKNEFYETLNKIQNLQLRLE